jgi:hypothetical protein
MITREEFVEAAGCQPEDDDLERVNCDKAGEIGHSCCGWNKELKMPQFLIGPLPLKAAHDKS